MNWRFALAVTLLVLPNLAAAQSASGRLQALTAARQKQAAELEDAPTPRMPDGHPDLNGNWTFQDEFWTFLHPKVDAKGDVCLAGNCGPAAPDPPKPAAAPIKPDAGSAVPALPNFPHYKSQFQPRIVALRKDLVGTDPILYDCANPGLPRIGPPAYIIQTPKSTVFLYDNVDGNFWRIIPTDGARHNADADPYALGDSIGSWDGDTLVVEAVNFTENTWLTDYGAFHTTNLKVVERFTRKGNAIIYQVTAYDPGVLSEPWTMHHVLVPMHETLQPSAPCIERDMSKMKNESYHPNPP
ncbi:MAG: hypothetical protein ACREU2_02790 [Steroidobacteraceae bacterium]